MAHINLKKGVGDMYFLRIEYKDDLVFVPLLDDKEHLAPTDNILQKIAWNLTQLLPEQAPDDSGVVVFSMWNEENSYVQVAQYPVNNESYGQWYLVLNHLSLPQNHEQLCQALAKQAWSAAEKALPSNLRFVLTLRKVAEMLSN